MSATIVLIIIAVMFVLWIILIYNGLVRKRMYVKESWSNIDVQLKRKGNVLPNLVDVIKMQTTYEGELLEKLTKARTGIIDGTPKDRMDASDSINKMMPSIYAVAENYPSLGANESFRKLREEIRDSEDKITYARQRYNVTVNDLNTSLQVFPSNIIGKMFGFKAEEFFEIQETQRQDFDNMRIKDLT
jgi:LemA protein